MDRKSWYGIERERAKEAGRRNDAFRARVKAVAGRIGMEVIPLRFGDCVESQRVVMRLLDVEAMAERLS